MTQHQVTVPARSSTSCCHPDFRFVSTLHNFRKQFLLQGSECTLKVNESNRKVSSKVRNQRWRFTT
eukprot:316061-Amphidinium_carterae.1